MSDTVLVTGATGTIGSKIVHHLVKRGKTVRAGVHSDEKAYKVHGPLVETVKFDFDDFDSVRTSLEGVSRVVLALPYGPDQNSRTRRFLEIASLFPIEHIVKISMIGADSSPGIHLSRWHRQDESYIESSGIPFTFLRPNSLMQDFITMAPPTAGLIYLPMGDGRVSYVDAQDVARVACEALCGDPGRWRKVYELTGPRSLSMDDITRIMSETAGVHISYVDIPEATARHALVTSGMQKWRIESLLELHRINRAGLAAGVTNAIRDVTGQEPRTFEDFAAANAETFRALARQARQKLSSIE